MKKTSSSDQKVRIKQFLAREIDPAFARRARIILEELAPGEGMRVLEVGCGRGFYEQAISSIYPQVHIVGTDVNEGYLAIARKATTNKYVRFQKADATSLPFDDNVFDRVICTEVLEHIPDDQKVTQEIYRVLKKGGKALFTVPNKDYPFLWDPLNFILEHTIGKHVPSHIWWLAGIWADHVRLYSEEDIKRVVTQSGLKIEKIWQSTSYSFPFAHFLLYGIGKNLVESGLVGGSFNRFSFDQKLSVLLKIVKIPFFLVDHMNDAKGQHSKRFVNFVLQTKK